MGTGYRNPLPPAHDVDQGIGPMDDRNPAAARFGQFYVSIADGRRNDDDLGILQIFRTLADADTGPVFSANCSVTGDALRSEPDT